MRALGQVVDSLPLFDDQAEGAQFLLVEEGEERLQVTQILVGLAGIQLSLTVTA